MLGFGRSARGCERPAIRLARIVLTLLPVMLLMPSVAVGCPSRSGVTAMKGTATTSFQGTASGSDNEGGTLVISLSRGGTVNVLFPKRVPPTGDGSTEFLGATGGGSLHVNDTSTDTFTSTAGSQSGDGPVVTSTTLGDLASVVLDRAACTYQLHIGFSVQTSTTGELPFTQDPGGGGFAITPVRPIPANLALVGAATVPVYSDCGSSGASPPGGCYGAALGLSGPSNWEGEYDLLKSWWVGGGSDLQLRWPGGDRELQLEHLALDLVGPGLQRVGWWRDEGCAASHRRAAGPSRRRDDVSAGAAEDVAEGEAVCPRGFPRGWCWRHRVHVLGGNRGFWAGYPDRRSGQCWRRCRTCSGCSIRERGQVRPSGPQLAIDRQSNPDRAHERAGNRIPRCDWCLSP